jgi:hypothetical protein
MAFLGLLAMGMAACESDRSQLGASTSLVVAWPYVSLYEAAGGVPTKLVARTQVDCIDAATTLERVRPRDYVVVVESVTTTPWVHGETALTVVAEEDAAVHLNL